MPEQTIFSASSGLNTAIDPARIHYNPKTGYAEFAVAVNVDFDDTGRPSRRKGFTLRTAGDLHSLYCGDGEVCLCVRGGALCLVEPDLSLTPIRNVNAGAPMSYAHVDHRTFYANGVQSGYVDSRDRLSHAWVQGEFVGETNRSFIDPPVGTIVRYCNGHVLIADGSTLWRTEPGDYTRVDPVRGWWSFETGAITTVRPVADGFFVCAGDSVFSVTGPDLQQAVKRKVAAYPVFSGTDIPVYGRPQMMPDGSFYVDDRQRTLGAMWLARDGVYFGGTDGQVINLTKHRIALLPAGTTGAAILKDNRYVATIAP